MCETTIDRRRNRGEGTLSASELVVLAEKFLSLSNELEAVRNAMRAALANGADPSHVRPTHAGKRPGKKTEAKAKPAHPDRATVLAKSAAADEALLALLKEKPGARPTEIAEATGAAGTTTSMRLKRLADRGLIERRGDGWTATAT
jgi:hypothetical protein